MKKILLVILSLIVLTSIAVQQKLQAMSNPWVDCGADFECAQKVSGITFPLKLSNYWIRAMKDMIEIGYPLDEFRDVEVRKSTKDLGGDISGVYTKYPINRKMKLENGVVVDTRGTLRKIYVMNMGAETGYYSAYCEKGMTKKEVQGIYEVLREAEEPKLPPEATQNKYSFCELGDLVGPDVKRIMYHNYYLDYHSKDYTKKQVLQLADECLNEGVGSQREMDCCLTMKMFPKEVNEE